VKWSNLELTRMSSLALAAMALVFTTTSCEDDEPEDDGNNNTEMSTYNYFFNNGEVAAGTAYSGTHRTEFTADLEVESKGENAEITVTLNNTADGETYMVHAHDAADPSTTPNGTPYDETPNGDVLVLQIEGNGGTVSRTQETNGFSYTEITSSYEGFFVVHDPLQPINTADISTYLVVGAFARDQGQAPSYDAQTFNYNFNTGQINSAFAYMGSHASSLDATLMVEELANGNSRVSVELSNTMSGEAYAIHSHDKADPSTTPNGTPYDETPNANVLVQNANSQGGELRAAQISSESYTELTTNYEGFFVVHDPLQPINTADPTTYLILGNFAR